MAVHNAFQIDGAYSECVEGFMAPKERRKAGMAVVALLATVSYP
jgi:hypothetical protein